MGIVRVGISGWRYPRWRGDFYPKGLRQKDELAYAASKLASIELNGTFYSLQRPGCFRDWYAATPEGFVFAVKGGRFVTHMKKLRDVDTALANFFASGLLRLREKLGPVLWQLPERLPFDPARMEDFFATLPRDTAAAAALARRHGPQVEGRAWTEVEADVPIRHALEPRHPTFFTPEAFDLLRRHDVALVLADTAGRWPYAEELTADFVYVRLHGAEQLYWSGYTADQLDGWAEKIRAWRKKRDVYVYFDNDAQGRAPWDALALASRL